MVKRIFDRCVNLNWLDLFVIEGYRLLMRASRLAGPGLPPPGPATPPINGEGGFWKLKRRD